nr:MAG TPA: PP-loop family [Caudoviricetes sp.]
MKYIAPRSFGKDSVATVLLALEYNEPLDEVVFTEVMYNHAWRR